MLRDFKSKNNSLISKDLINKCLLSPNSSKKPNILSSFAFMKYSTILRRIMLKKHFYTSLCSWQNSIQ